MHTFQASDKVRLASGGPVMTFCRYGYALRRRVAECIWFVGNKVYRQDFPPESLVPVD